MKTWQGMIISVVGHLAVVCALAFAPPVDMHRHRSCIEVQLVSFHPGNRAPLKRRRVKEKTTSRIVFSQWISRTAGLHLLRLIWKNGRRRINPMQNSPERPHYPKGKDETCRHFKGQCRWIRQSASSIFRRSSSRNGVCQRTAVLHGIPWTVTGRRFTLELD